jgi:hypothetical protein
MNWRAGLFRTWIVASVVWAATITFFQIQSLFWVVHVDDVLGKPWLPWWASLTSHVQPYADASLWTHQGPLPAGADLSPSKALVAARAGDMLIEIVGVPLIVLLLGVALRWVAAGFRARPSN